MVSSQAESQKIWLNNFKKLFGIQNPFEKKMKFMAYLTAALSSHDIRPVVVGGQAVEFYAAGGYSTGDIDLISPGEELIGKYLELAGFSRKGRFWHHPELDLFVEVPGSALTAAEEAHLTEVRTDEGKIFLIGVEDLVIDRLNAFVHWKSDDDGRWARELMTIHKESIDWEYLTERARQEKTEAALEIMKKEIEQR